MITIRTCETLTDPTGAGGQVCETITMPGGIAVLLAVAACFIVAIVSAAVVSAIRSQVKGPACES